MDLKTLIEQGTLGKPEKVIKTLLSDLFFIGEKVIKVYKHKEAFYGDLSDSVFRKDFYIEDFFWNNSLAPEIYTRLVGVKLNGEITETDVNNADDFYIEMKKIDSSQNLTNLFNKGKVSEEDITHLIKIMVVKIRELTREKQEKLKDIFSLGWQELIIQDIEDLREWMYLAAEHISKEKTNEYIDFIKKVAASNVYLKECDNTKLVVSIDNNPDNVLILNGTPSFIDIMPPKPNWKVCEEFYNVTRTAVDCFVLGGESFGQTAYNAYREFGEEPKEIAKLLYEIRSSLIQWPLRHILGQHDLAEKYKKFTLSKIGLLELALKK